MKIFIKLQRKLLKWVGERIYNLEWKRISNTIMLGAYHFIKQICCTHCTHSPSLEKFSYVVRMTHETGITIKPTEHNNIISLSYTYTFSLYSYNVLTNVVLSSYSSYFYLFKVFV